MSRAAFRQADMERVIRAAVKSGAFVQMDMKTLIATVMRANPENLLDEEGNPLGTLPSGNFAPDGKENWDED